MLSKDKSFDNFYEDNKIAITKGQQRNATKYEQKVAGDLIATLQNVADSWILQRSVNGDFKGQLPPKEEYVVWVQPSEAQWTATQIIINSDDAERAKESGNRVCIFAVIQRLRMVALHPFFESRLLRVVSNNVLERGKSLPTWMMTTC